jgi:hypothetical protein
MIPAAQSSEEGVDEWMAGMWDLDARASQWRDSRRPVGKNSTGCFVLVHHC